MTGIAWGTNMHQIIQLKHISPYRPTEDMNLDMNQKTKNLTLIFQGRATSQEV